MYAFTGSEISSGPGFQERAYKNALLIVMKQKGLQVEVEKPFEVILDFFQNYNPVPLPVPVPCPPFPD